ncbi:MAG: FdtA/QdtA family cupin domain-containing protein [Verrucomicrobiota bacterium]
MTIDDCNIINLQKIADPRGNLTFIEGNRHVPFDIKRVFYLYDVPGGADRGGHALKTCQQFLIAMSGSFDVILKDGRNERRIHLNRSYYGLLIAPMVWREMDNFSSGSVCLVVASENYDASNYIRDFGDFMKTVPAGR